MPGPRNNKKKTRKSQANKAPLQKKFPSEGASPLPEPKTTPHLLTTSNDNSCPSTPPITTPPPLSPHSSAPNDNELVANESLERMLQEECQLDPDEKDVVDLKHSSTICSTSPPEPLSPPPPPIVPGSIASLEAQAECADLPPIPTSSRPRSSCFSRQQQQHRHTSDVLLEEPYIYDPGSGPRVRNARVFLDSYFALPVSSDDALCEEFGKDEVRDMLLSVLPEELALTLWYNKSRLTGRVCPTCRRLYRVGDALHDLTLGPQDKSDQPPLSKNNSPPAVLDQLRNEQDLSGLCSPICFIMASYSFPAAMKATWGRTADELDDDTWAMLNSPGSISGKPSDPSKAGEGDPFLGLIVRMTRLADLGLAQMLFPGEAMEQGDDQWEGEEEERGKSKREEVVDLSDEVD